MKTIHSLIAGLLLVFLLLPIAQAQQSGGSPTLGSPQQSPYSIGAWATPYGTLHVTPETQALLADPFAGSSFDANRWTTGGTNGPTVTGGIATLSLTTSANQTTTLASAVNFAPTLGFQLFAAVVNLETSQITNPNDYREWGFCQVNTFAYATPCTNGPTFEVDGTGALNAVFWINGTRYVANSTNPALITAQGSLPAGSATTQLAAMTWAAMAAGPHVYIIEWRADTAVWFVDNQQVPIAVFKNPTIDTSNVPVLFGNATGASGVSATTFQIYEAGEGDTSNPQTSLSDGTYPIRKATVDISGNLHILESTASVYNGSGSVSHSAVTTAYAANQLFANNTSGNAAATQITVTGTAAGTGFITHALIASSGTNLPPTETLYLFSAAPTTTGLIDYSAYLGPYLADVTGGSYIGSLTCSNWQKTNDASAKYYSECSTSNASASAMEFQATAGQTYIQVLEQVGGAYTPLSGETHTYLLSTVRNN